DADLELVLRDRVRVEHGPVELAVGLGELRQPVRERGEAGVGRGELVLERLDLLLLRELGRRGPRRGDGPDAGGREGEGEEQHEAGVEHPAGLARLHLLEGAGLVIVVVVAVLGHERRATGADGSRNRGSPWWTRPARRHGASGGTGLPERAGSRTGHLQNSG